MPRDLLANPPQSNSSKDLLAVPKPALYSGGFRQDVKDLGTEVKNSWSDPNNPIAGIAKGVGSTLFNVAKLGQKVTNKAADVTGIDFLRSDIPDLGEKPDFLKPKGTGQRIGFGAEQIGEFLIPIGLAGKGAQVLAKVVPKAGKVAQVVAKGTETALDFAIRTAAQTGGDAKEIKKAAITGAIFPPALAGAGALVKKIAPKIGNAAAGIVAQMIGKNPEHVKIAFQNPEAVAKAISEKRIPLEVRDKALSALQKFRYDPKTGFASAFQRTLNEVKKLYPYGKTGRLLIEREVKDSIKGVPAVFRKFRIGATGKNSTLDFNKLNSAIVSPGEQKNLQIVWDTVRNQKDFSVQGVQDVAARLNALSRFEEGAKTRQSAIVSEIHKLYDKAIIQTYPELGKLRSAYRSNVEIYNGIDSVLKSVANETADPTRVTTAVRKLSNLFNEDNEAYLHALQRLEKVSGVDLLKDLAATEFRNLTPGRLGSVLAQSGVLAGGIFTNPLILAALPLFSPKVQGTLITKLGKLAPTVSKATPKILNATPKVLLPLSRQ